MFKNRIFVFLLFLGALLYWIYLTQNQVGFFGEELNAASGKIGQMADDFQVVDEKGKKLSLADLKGKVVLLHFWATWCPPCASEFPSLNTFVDSFKDKDFAIVAVSLDEEKKAVSEFRKKIKFNFPIYFDPEGTVVADKYGTYRLPESYLINKEGKIVRKITGPQEWLNPAWKQRIQELL